MGIFCTGIADFLMYSGSQTVKKQNIGILQIIENVIPIVFGVLLFKEQLNLQMFFGMVILFASILIISIEKNKRHFIDYSAGYLLREICRGDV